MKKYKIIPLLLSVELMGALMLQLGGSPASAQSQSFVFTAGGDWGWKAETQGTLNAIKNSGSVFTLVVGDMSYQDAGTEPTDGITPSPWCAKVKSILGDTYPFEILVGNHEDDGHVDGFIDNFATCLPDKMGSTGRYDAEYYFDYPQAAPLMRSIMIGAGNDVKGVAYDYIKGNSHYNWLVNVIDDARAKGIKWITVGMHKNCLTMGNKPCEIGSDLLNLLVTKKIDLVVQGHDHDYQRSKQINTSSSCTTVPISGYNAGCVADDGFDNLYTKGNGPVFVIVGNTGGGGFTSINCSDPERFYFVKSMGGDSNIWNGSSCSIGGAGRGAMKFTVSQDRMDAQFMMGYQIHSGTAFSDNFSIVSSGGSTSTPIPTIPSTPTPTSVPTPTQSPIPTIVPTSTPASCSNTIPANSASSTSMISVAAGTYKVWSRILGQGSGANSYWLQVDNGCPVNVGDLSTSTAWEWVDYQDGNSANKILLDLADGNHTVKIAAREQNVGVDNLIFTKDYTCVPTGTGDNCSGVVVTPTPVTTTQPSGTPGSTTTVTLPVVADTYVSSGSAQTNYGTAAGLFVDGNGTVPSEITYFKFDLTPYGGKTIVSAKLRLTTSADTNAGSSEVQTVKLVTDSSWTESGMTYSNRPPGPTVLGTANGSPSNTTIEVTLNSASLNAIVGQMATMSVEQIGTNGWILNSKEAASGKAELILELQSGTSASPTPTPVPGDATGDNVVDGKDYTKWLNNYNTTTTAGASVGDFNNDGKVDGRDYVIWLNNYTL